MKLKQSILPATPSQCIDLVEERRTENRINPIVSHGRIATDSRQEAVLVLQFHHPSSTSYLNAPPTPAGPNRSLSVSWSHGLKFVGFLIFFSLCLCFVLLAFVFSLFL